MEKSSLCNTCEYNEPNKDYHKRVHCWGCYHPHSGSYVYFKLKNNAGQG